MKNKRREVEGISLSFLDVVSCGFGAIILLLVLTKVFDPIVLEETIEDITAYLEQLEAQLFDIRGETRELNREMIRKEDEKIDELERLAQLEAKLKALKGQYEATVDKSKIDNTIQGQLAEAKQKMTLELQKLLVDYQKQQEANMIGGIPVDSEYVIFLIDTSGSMRSVAWPLVIRKVSETLAVYPQLKGIQVMNDQGHYMFPRFAGEWIVDTQQRRREIIERLSFWQAQSRSNPTNGIADAVGTFYRPGRKISIYVFGDDFKGRSFSGVIDRIDQINTEDENGERLVRIHGIGFPVQFANAVGGGATGYRFAHFMRVLCERNGGTFVGLNSFGVF